jgi:hypothetical protein
MAAPPAKTGLPTEIPIRLHHMLYGKALSITRCPFALAVQDVWFERLGYKPRVKVHERIHERAAPERSPLSMRSFRSNLGLRYAL